MACGTGFRAGQIQPIASKSKATALNDIDFSMLYASVQPI